MALCEQIVGLPVDELVCPVNDAIHVSGEFCGVHSVARRETHCAPDVRREALGLSHESTAESHPATPLRGERRDISWLKRLKRIQDDAFFACTFKLPGGHATSSTR